MTKHSSKKSVNWDEQFGHWNQNQQLRWRQYSDWVSIHWLQRWWPTPQPQRVLKTDLFDEATSTGLMSWLAEHSKILVGVDISEKITRSAKDHSPAPSILTGDVRRLPFPDKTFDLIVSPSTLDHFGAADEIDSALRELRRVLVPGGKLFLTLDNLANPIVWIRNILPAGLLICLGLLPYPMGVSCTPTTLHSKLQKAGISLSRSTAILHCPRAMAVALFPFLGPRNYQLLFQWLKKFEKGSDWSTRYFTGYFIAIEGVRKD